MRLCARVGRREGSQDIAWGVKQAQRRHPEAFLQLREGLRGGHWLVAARSESSWSVLWPSGTVAAPGTANTAKLTGEAGSEVKVSVFWSGVSFGRSELESRADIQQCATYVIGF